MTERSYLTYRAEVVRAWPAGERQVVTLAAILYRMWMLSQEHREGAA